MEVSGVFLDVCFDRKEILIDERRDFIVGIGFGLQPNARASSRSRAEIKQQELLSSLCLRKYRINIFLPFNRHFLNLLKTYLIRCPLAVAEQKICDGIGELLRNSIHSVVF